MVVLSSGNIVAVDEIESHFFQEEDYNGNNDFSGKELGNAQRSGCIRAESLSILMLCRCEIREYQLLVNMAAFKAVTKRWKAVFCSQPLCSRALKCLQAPELALDAAKFS